MKKNNDFNGFSLGSFFSILKERKRNFKNASFSSVPREYPVNKAARLLHPKTQYVKVSDIFDHGDAKTYRFVLSDSMGTEENKSTSPQPLAFFSAGQYISVKLEINGCPVTRAYSLSSSPKDSLAGFYEITVKAVEGGLCSTYILENWSVGTEVEISSPQGSFSYSPLRDGKTVIGIAGGSGITPFLSMAKAIAEGTEHFPLSLLYGSRNSSSILFKKEFDELQKRCDKIKVIYVLSEEDNPEYEHGFITSELIKKYSPGTEENNPFPYSIFMCGPQAMYNFLDSEISKLSIPQKNVRHEMFGEIHGAKLQSDYPGEEKAVVNITVIHGGQRKTFHANPDHTILQLLEQNGVSVPSRCRSGECGWCHSLLKSGKVYVPQKVDFRRKADFTFNYIHPCCTFALSDIEIEIK